jgi:hypothetical protein
MNEIIFQRESAVTTKSSTTPPVASVNRKPEAKTARRNRRWLQCCVRPFVYVF